MNARDEPSARINKSPMAGYARLLDSSIRLPGGFRIGIDGLIGLIPGVGDVVAALLSGVIVVHSYREGASPAVIVRMLGNIAAELLVGTVPIVGDLFDFVFRANERNVRLMDQFVAEPKKVKRRSTGLVVGVALVLLGLLSFMAVIVWSLLSIILSAVLAL